MKHVRYLLSSVSESNSEYEWLLLIQTPVSYKLNPTTLGTFTRQNGMMVKVIGVTKKLRTVEKTGSLDDLLLSVVDETLKQVFREAGAKVIYSYIENRCHLKREEIAERPEVFSVGLKMMLGSGALVIEKMILKDLYLKLELKFAEKKGYVFSDYIRDCRRNVDVKG